MFASGNLQKRGRAIFTILTAAALVTTPPTAQPSAADLYHQVAGCMVDLKSMLELSPYDFDQTEKGWRSLDAKPGCHVAAADLIATYRRANWGKIDANGVAISYWHEGQARAIGGETKLAIPLLLAGVNPGFTGAGPEVDRQSSPLGMANAQYALATVAFLQADLATLKLARARLAELPAPESYKGIRPEPVGAAKWPPNLNVVDGLIACFGKPYAVAYGCRPR